VGKVGHEARRRRGSRGKKEMKRRAKRTLAGSRLMTRTRASRWDPSWARNFRETQLPPGESGRAAGDDACCCERGDMTWRRFGSGEGWNPDPRVAGCTDDDGKGGGLEALPWGVEDDDGLGGDRGGWGGRVWGEDG
jgi:hypothetical protein